MKQDEPSQMGKGDLWSPVALTYMAHNAEISVHTSFTLKAVLLVIHAAGD